MTCQCQTCSSMPNFYGALKTGRKPPRKCQVTRCREDEDCSLCRCGQDQCPGYLPRKRKRSLKPGKPLFKGRTDCSRDDWETPPYFFRLLDDEFHFTLDPAASDQNHKCPKYYTIQDDGLAKSWAGETAFVNPPFCDKKAWIKKCYKEALNPITKVVLIMPVSSDIPEWHCYVMEADEIRFCLGRVNFVFPASERKSSPGFPLSIVVFRLRRQPYLKVSSFIHKLKGAPL